MQRWMSVVWAAGVGVAITAPAVAQSTVKDIEPYIAVVSTDKVAMRGGDAAFMYAVRELKQGEMLRITGEGPGWVRAEYLPGMRAYVTASDVEPAKDGKTVKLVRQSQLMALEASPSPKAPWWPLDLEKPLDSGTTLDVLSIQKGSDEVVQGYIVPAPAKARGYVAKEHVRKATAEEASKFAPGAAAIAPPPTTPDKPTDAVAKPTDSTAKPVDSTPPTTTPATKNTPSGFTPVTPVPTEQSGTSTTSPKPASTPAIVQPAVPAAPRPDEEVAQLRTMFDKTMAAKDDGELPAVVGMFERKMSKLGDSAADQNMKTQLGQRLQVLKLRQEITLEAQRAKDAVTQSASRVTEVTLMVEQAQKQAIYTVVGRIVPSTVYDGKRGLPLMYRVQSADALAPRTVGYILPKENDDLVGKLGQVCGVVGETRFDDSLGLNIVSPRRIDVLGVNINTPAPAPAPMVVTPAAPPATASVPTEDAPHKAEPEK